MTRHRIVFCWLLLWVVQLLTLAARCNGQSWLSGATEVVLVDDHEIRGDFIILPEIVPAESVVIGIFTTHSIGTESLGWTMDAVRKSLDAPEISRIYLHDDGEPYPLDVDGSQFMAYPRDLGRGTRQRPWISRHVYVIPGVEVHVIGEHGEELWTVPTDFEGRR